MPFNRGRPRSPSDTSAPAVTGAGCGQARIHLLGAAELQLQGCKSWSGSNTAEREEKALWSDSSTIGIITAKIRTSWKIRVFYK